MGGCPRMLQPVAVVVLLLLALAPLLSPNAAAGTAEEPEIRDARDQRRPSVDLLAAWFENTHEGMRFSIQVAGLDESPRGHAFFIGFRTGEGRYVGNVVFDREGEPHSIAARVGYGSDYDGVDSYPDNILHVDLRLGEPAVVSGVIPWGAVPGFETGTTLTSLYAGTDDGSVSGRDYVDLGQTRSPFTLREAPAPVGLAGGAAPLQAQAGLVMLGTTLLGGAAAFVLARPHAPDAGLAASARNGGASGATAPGDALPGPRPPQPPRLRPPP